MVTITVNAQSGSDFTKAVFSYPTKPDSYSYGWGYFGIGGGGRFDGYTGTGFDYADGRLVAGTVTGWSVSWLPDQRFSISGLKISAEKLMKVVLSATKADDSAIIASFLVGDDRFTGGKLTDVIKLYGGDDIAYGKNGADKLYGGFGDDALIGGQGADDLFGEAGRDTFIYKSVTDSSVADAGRDTIFDFQSGDRIHLSAIDANTKLAGDQAFSFIAKSAFHGKAGEVRFEVKASDTYIYADVDGDKKADFAIHLDDAVTISKGYFLL